MENKEPTEVEIKEFWEGNGLTFDKYGWHWKHDWFPSALPIDLNNLFKYAVPKVMEYYKAESTLGYLQTANYLMEEWVSDWLDSDNAYNPDLALFWALWAVMKEAK